MTNMENILALLMSLLCLLNDVQGEPSGLICIPGVESFSSTLSPRHYYTCELNNPKAAL